MIKYGDFVSSPLLLTLSSSFRDLIFLMIYLMCSRVSELGKEKSELKKKSLTALFVKFMVFSPTAVNFYQADENYSAIYDDFARLPQQIYKRTRQNCSDSLSKISYIILYSFIS